LFSAGIFNHLTLLKSDMARVVNNEEGSAPVAEIHWLWIESDDQDTYEHMISYICRDFDEKFDYEAVYAEALDVPSERLDELSSEHDVDIIDVDISELRSRLGKLRHYDVPLADGGYNDDDGLSRLRSFIKDQTGINVMNIGKFVPLELGNRIFSEGVSRVRVIHTTKDQSEEDIIEQINEENKYRERSQDTGNKGPAVYNGPIHAYAKVKEIFPPFKQGDFFQLRAPITITWHEDSGIKCVDDVISYMKENGWGDNDFLDQNRYVVYRDESGPTGRKHKSDTTDNIDPDESEEGSPEEIMGRTVSFNVDSAQWHLRLFNHPSKFDRFASNYTVSGQAHKDPWHHDIPPFKNEVTFNDGRDAVEEVWDCDTYSCETISVSNEELFDSWDGEMIEVK